ncbi:hypothetical protein [Paenarthrobacter nicotinovorans]|uniref:hypothetical protein n=1 Tax=Paenarthrobacter nicotinovorans TaxID=29320 RepID=UPI003D66728F
MLFDGMSYRTKIAVAVIATIVAVGSIVGVILLAGLIAGGQVPYWLILIPAVLTGLWIPMTGWLWKNALLEREVATGKLYKGEQLARQLVAEHGGELIHNERGADIRNWSITVEGADGFNRTIMTRSGKEVR